MRTGAGAILAAIMSIGAASALPSCGDGFEPPCRVTSRDALLPASELVGRSPLGLLAEGSEGEIVVLSMIGDARRANADKGKKLLAVCAEGLAATLKNREMWA